MGAKFKEVNTLSFIGNTGRMARLSFKSPSSGFDLEQ